MFHTLPRYFPLVHKYPSPPQSRLKIAEIPITQRRHNNNNIGVVAEQLRAHNSSSGVSDQQSVGSNPQQ